MAASSLAGVDWQEVKTLSIALGVREAARKMGLNEDTVKARSRREGWLVERHEAEAVLSPDARRRALQTISPTAPIAPTAAEILAKLGPDSKSKLAIAGNRAVTRLAEMDGDELIVPEVAQTAKTWASTLATAHSWEREGSGGNTVVNIAFLGAPDDTVTIDVDSHTDTAE